jgi:hypothetical protein
MQNAETVLEVPRSHRRATCIDRCPRGSGRRSLERDLRRQKPRQPPPSPCGTAFPPALVRRNSHDYYEACVTIGLAPLRVHQEITPASELHRFDSGADHIVPLPVAG